MEGEMNGEGVIVFPNGARYQGSMKNNKFEGSGLLTFKNQEQYQG